MILIILAFLLTCIIAYKETKDFQVGILIGIAVVLPTLMIAGALTTTNQPQYYAYEAERQEIAPFENAYALIESDTIYYMRDGRLCKVPTQYAHFMASDDPHLLYFHQCGFNKENAWRWLYTFPSARDYLEFHIPESTLTWFGGAK